MSRCLPAVVLALAFSLPVLADTADRPPLSHGAMWLAERVGEPTVSPDGAWAVFGVTEPSYEPDEEVSDLWIVPVDGSAAPRRLTATSGGEGALAWSPDSTRLAFVAKRGEQEKAQVWVLPLADGGEARPVTSTPLGAGNPRWSPDGGRLLFQSRGYPGAVGEKANAEALEADEDDPTNLLEYEHFPIRRWDRWLDETRPRIYVIEVAEALAHEPSDSPERLAAEHEIDEDGKAAGDGEDAGQGGVEEAEEETPDAVDLIGASELAASVGFRGDWGLRADGLSAIWTPDGRGVVFVATDVGHTAARASVQSQLWWVASDGGEPRRLTASDASFSSPAFSPEGRWLCFLTADDRDVIYAQTDAACAPWDGGPPPAALEVENLTADLDRLVSSFVFAPADPAGPGLYLTVYEAGHVHIEHVAFGSLGHRRVAATEVGVYGGLSTPDRAAGDPVLVGVWGSANRPNEIVRIDVGSGERTLLTRFNAEDAERWDWPPLKEFWTDGPEGRRLHSFLVLPPDFDPAKRYPILAMMHGGHASMWRDAIHPRWNYHLLSQPGFVIVATDYRGSVGYGEDFTLAIVGDPLRGPVEDIVAGVDDAARRFDFVDGDRVGAIGASYGGHLANWIAGASDRFDCIVSHAGLASLEQQWTTSDVIHHREIMMGGPFWEDPETWLDQSPLMQAPGFDVPILMSIGVDDYRVPLGNTLAMWSALERMDAPNRLLVWKKSNHWIMHPRDNQRFYREVRTWLERWLLTDAEEAGSGSPGPAGRR
ncbi:MAG: S9 family peptidase [Thermoanaerobaculia bacterium]